MRVIKRMTTASFRRCMRALLAVLPATLLLAAVSLIAPQQAFACSCVAFESAQASAEMAEVVFVGTAIEQGAAPQSEISGNQVSFTFEVSEVRKGTAAATTEILTADNSASCGLTFDLGQSYVVMATVEDGVLSSNLCSGTAPASQYSEADLATIGPAMGPGPGSDAGVAAPGAPEQHSPAHRMSEGPNTALGWGLGGLALVALVMFGAIWWPRRELA